MAGFVPAIHAFIFCKVNKAWMPGMKPGMTTEIEDKLLFAAFERDAAASLEIY